MLRKVIALAMAMLLLSAGAALAASGEIILKDTLFGGLIGGLLGGAWYLLDDDEAAHKIGTGIGVGIIGGFVLGITDASAMAKVENGKVELAMPVILIDREKGATTYTAHLLEMDF